MFRIVWCTGSESDLARRGVSQLWASDFERYFAKLLDRLYSLRYCRGFCMFSSLDFPSLYDLVSTFA